MDKSSKSKEQRLGQKLLWSSEFAFVSPYSVDECIEKFNALEAKYRKESYAFWKGTSLKIETLTDNGGVVHFEIKANATKQTIEVRSVGQLIYKHTNRTLVRTDIGVTRKSVIEDVILNLIVCALFSLAYMSITAFVTALLMIGLVQFIAYASFTLMRSELRATVYEALSIKPAPRPTTLPR